ncbi:hypothetical protein ACFFX0_27755 [Citricoccus parietis]|uniref:Uncharacterized protein n=1 Tax=Citricoccus parietis TaxID=592307 RepID=A0ABV5G753_9MICC
MPGSPAPSPSAPWCAWRCAAPCWPGRRCGGSAVAARSRPTRDAHPAPGRRAVPGTRTTRDPAGRGGASSASRREDHRAGRPVHRRRVRRR